MKIIVGSRVHGKFDSLSGVVASILVAANAFDNQAVVTLDNGESQQVFMGALVATKEGR